MSKRVLIVSHAPWVPSGYGRVVDNIIKSNDGKLDIHVLGRGHFGNTITYYDTPIHGRGFDEYGYDMFPYLMKVVKPDYVISLCDIGFQEPYGKILERMRSDGIWKGKWLGYIPVDTHEPVAWMKPIFESMDEIVTMSEFGRDTLKEKFGLDSICIPHGVDTTVYHPLEPKERIMLRKEAGLDGKFVVLSVGLNQTRKMWDRLLKGFSLFAKGKDDVIFLMHTDLRCSDSDSHKGFDIGVIADKYGISDKCRFTVSTELLNKMPNIWRQLINEDTLNKIYNTADIGLFGGAEGFGLPELELQSSGLPVIIGNQCTASELLGGGCLVPCDGYIEGSVGVEFKTPDVIEIANALQEFYSNRKMLIEEGKKARAKALLYDWSKIMPLWFEAIK